MVLRTIHRTLVDFLHNLPSERSTRLALSTVILQCHRHRLYRLQCNYEIYKQLNSIYSVKFPLIFPCKANGGYVKHINMELQFVDFSVARVHFNILTDNFFQSLKVNRFFIRI